MHWCSAVHSRDEVHLDFGRSVHLFKIFPIVCCPCSLLFSMTNRVIQTRAYIILQFLKADVYSNNLWHRHPSRPFLLELETTYGQANLIIKSIGMNLTLVFSHFQWSHLSLCLNIFPANPRAYVSHIIAKKLERKEDYLRHIFSFMYCVNTCTYK